MAIRTFRNTRFLGDSIVSGESPMPSLAPDGGRVRRRIQLAPGADWYQAAVDFLGYSQVVEGTTRKNKPARYIARSIPHSFRGMTIFPAGAAPAPNPTPRADWLWAKSVPGVQNMRPTGRGNLPGVKGAGLEVAAGGLDTAVGYYDQSKLDLEYRTLTYDVVADTDPTVIANDGVLEGLPHEGLLVRYVSRYFRPGKKIVNLKRGLMYYVPANADEGEPQPIPEGIPLEIPSATLTIIWHEVPLGGVPYLAIANCLGCVNNSVFDNTYGAGFPAQTVLFDSFDLKQEFNVVGQRIFDVQYVFKIAYNIDLKGIPRGWNYFLRKVPNSENVDYREVASYKKFANLWRKGNNPYRIADFTTLFRPDQNIAGNVG